MRPNSRYMQTLTSAFGKLRDVLEMAPSGNTMLISRADALDQPADLGKVGRAC